MQTKITVDQWHELPDEKKERVRKWAVNHNLGLEMIPSDTAETCDYAALLSTEQMRLLLEELQTENNVLPDDCKVLWQEIQKVL